MTTIGIIGAGHIGAAFAHRSLDTGHDVVLAESRGPETLTDLVSGLQDRPFRPAGPLARTVVLDTCNDDPERDGRIAELGQGERHVPPRHPRRRRRRPRAARRGPAGPVRHARPRSGVDADQLRQAAAEARRYRDSA